MKKILFILLVSSLALAACSGGSGTPTPDSANVPIVSDNFAVSAEGRLVPGKFAELSFSGGGKVAEVLAAEGVVVSEGDVLARLENSESLQSSVAQAELELLNAQQAMDDLKNNKRQNLLLSFHPEVMKTEVKYVQVNKHGKVGQFFVEFLYH